MADIRRSGTKESLKELAEDEGKWLDITAEHILAGGKEAECVKVVSGNMGMEEAVEVCPNLDLMLESAASAYSADHDPEQLPVPLSGETIQLCFLRRELRLRLAHPGIH